jgi:hypothetical protein
MRGNHLKRAVNAGLVLLACGALLGSTACSLRAKKAAVPVTPAAPNPIAKSTAPPPAPPPLSTPQTHIELPAPQPIDTAALATENSPQDVPANTRPQAGPRRAPVAVPVVVTPPPAAPPVEPPRPTIQEMIPPTELKRLQDEAKSRRDEANQILEQLGKRKQAAHQSVVTSIRNFVTLSLESEQRNDMRQADALAEKAQILARELKNGK